jgi:hypothetical protein
LNRENESDCDSLILAVGDLNFDCTVARVVDPVGIVKISENERVRVFRVVNAMRVAVARQDEQTTLFINFDGAEVDVDWSRGRALELASHVDRLFAASLDCLGTRRNDTICALVWVKLVSNVSYEE